tara:strand:- start:951 stop:1580 length:630 start_codon:yes stop_codon:yes gene_type:complete
MKKFKMPFIAALVIMITAACTFQNQDDEVYKTLQPGDVAPMLDYKMQSISGENLSLNDLKEENGMLVIFSCNTCPFVVAWEDRYPELADIASQNEIGFALINSNQAKRDGEDSFDEMQRHATEKGYGDAPYLVDENSALANAFGAKTTPHVFLFNQDMTLVYVGAIDDNFKDASKVKETFLEDAINNMIEGNEITPNTTKAIGCSIKRV